MTTPDRTRSSCVHRLHVCVSATIKTNALAKTFNIYIETVDEEGNEVRVKAASYSHENRARVLLIARKHSYPIMTQTLDLVYRSPQAPTAYLSVGRGCPDKC